MMCQSLSGEQEESNEYPNRMSFSLNLFFSLSHLMIPAEDSSFGEQEKYQ